MTIFGHLFIKIKKSEYIIYVAAPENWDAVSRYNVNMYLGGMVAALVTGWVNCVVALVFGIVALFA